MIAIIKSGCTPDGLVDYCNNEIEKDAKLIGSAGVITTNNRAMAASFSLQSKSNNNVKKFIGHTVLAFNPDDKDRMTDELMMEIAKEYMKRMGIVNTQFAIYRHFDHDHDHVHIIYNRVDNNGEALKNSTNVNASIPVTQLLTRKYNLTFGKNKDRVNRDRLKGRDKMKYRFYDDIKPMLEKAINWSQFKDLLSKKGYNLRFNYDDKGNIKGVSFDNGQTSFSGRQLDRSLTYFSIDRQLNINVSKQVLHDDDESEKNGIKIGASLDKPSTSSGGGNGGSSSCCDNSADNIIEQEQNAAIVQQESDNSASGGSVVGAIAEAAAEIILQPNVVPSTGGGGGGSNLGWRDDDDKDKYKPRRGRGR